MPAGGTTNKNSETVWLRVGWCRSKFRALNEEIHEKFRQVEEDFR